MTACNKMKPLLKRYLLKLQFYINVPRKQIKTIALQRFNAFGALCWSQLNSARDVLFLEEASELHQTRDTVGLQENHDQASKNK
jgi:hypothetical protein